MRFVLILMAMVLGFSVSGAAQEINWLVPPEQGQIKKNIIFVVDKSASMKPDQVADAIQAVVNIASQSLDELNVGVMAFGGNCERWKGVKDEKLPEGWAALPSKEAVQAIKEWLETIEIENGSTHVAPAILKSMNASLAFKDLTIIVISDLEFNGGIDRGPTFITAITGAQASRLDAKLDPATFGFFGISASTNAVNATLMDAKLLNAWVCNQTHISKDESPAPDFAPTPTPQVGPY